MKVIFSIAILALALTSASAKVFTKCELARELYNLGKSMASLPDWVCLGLTATFLSAEPKRTYQSHRISRGRGIHGHSAASKIYAAAP